MSDWEGGERQGIRWRRIGAAVLTIAIVAGAGWYIRSRQGLSIDTEGGPIVEGGGEDEVEVVVRPPLRAGDRWYCPNTHPVAAFDSGTFRPGEYPDDVTATERPVDCYADVARAEGEGYELEDPPPGAIRAGGVYLVPTAAPSKDGCRHAADQVGFAAPCPTRLPAPGLANNCERLSCLYGEDYEPSGVLIEYRYFPVPADWSNDADPHIIISAAAVDTDDGAQTVEGPTELAACSRDSEVDVSEQTVFVDCPPGETWVPRFQGEPHEDHTAAFWRRGDVIYGVSVEGHGPTADELLHALVDDITYVEPS